MKKEVIEWVLCIMVAFVLAMFVKTFIGIPTIVKHASMYPTLQENQRLILNRMFRITRKKPEIGEIITFEAPSKKYTEFDRDQKNPIAIYENEVKGKWNQFVYERLEITKKSYIKRVIAIEGQHVVIENGKVYINGQEIEEAYLPKEVETKSNVFNDFYVPKGHLFAMGDNRENSMDCRELGCIPLGKVEGIVAFRFWPFHKISQF